jgi:endonuclease G
MPIWLYGHRKCPLYAQSGRAEASAIRSAIWDAGPILDPADQLFVGFGDERSVLRSKIPSRFWKVIVARVEDRIAAYAFVLE